jgi:hypothetical protein
MDSIQEIRKPANATWIARVTASPDAKVAAAPATAPYDHQFAEVDIAWYGNDKVKITFRGAGPAALRQAYLAGAGKDVELDLIAVQGGGA